MLLGSSENKFECWGEFSVFFFPKLEWQDGEVLSVMG